MVSNSPLMQRIKVVGPTERDVVFEKFTEYSV